MSTTLAALAILLRSVLLLAALTAPAGFDDPAGSPYLLRAVGVDPAILSSGDEVRVERTEDAWTFTPVGPARSTALLFFPGGRVEPTAYAPLAHACARRGYRVFLVDLTSTAFAASARKAEGIDRGRSIRAAHREIDRWVIAGHSLGAAIAAEAVHREPDAFGGLVLLATTHPRDFDLSKFPGAVAKVVGTADRVAPLDRSLENEALLPESTRWVRVEGGNHAQFGCYGPQIGDGEATIRRDAQQAIAVEAIAEVLSRVEPHREPTEPPE